MAYPIGTVIADVWDTVNHLIKVGISAGTAVIGKVRVVDSGGTEVTEAINHTLKVSGTVTQGPAGAAAWLVQQPAYTTPAHTAPTAGVASGVILAANANRLYALFVNDSDTPVYLALGGAAAINTGIRLNANGGSYEMSSALGNLYTGAVNGISGVAGKVVLVTEGV